RSNGAMSAALAQRTLRNSILVVGARALAKLAVFAVLVLLWRHLGAEAYGRFAAMVVYATLAGIAADLGLQTVFVRDVSRDAGAFDRYLANLLSVRLLLAVLALLLLAAALRLLSPALAPFTLGAFALLLMLFRWHDRLTLRLEPGSVLGLLGAGVPLALGFTLTTVYAQVDVVLLQLMRGFQMVGWYSAANKYVDAIAWIPQSAMGAVFPALALLSTGTRARLRTAYEKSYKMLAILGVPLAVGLALTAAPIVRATPGAFEQSIPALQILALSIVFLFVNNAFVYTLTAMNRQGDFT